MVSRRISYKSSFGRPEKVAIALYDGAVKVDNDGEGCAGFKGRGKEDDREA